MKSLNLNRFPFALVLLFTLFIVYGTIIPFNIGGISNFPNKVKEINWKPFFALDGCRTSFSDVVQNILLFIPVGMLGWFSVSHNKNKRYYYLIVTLYGTFLSISVECMQLLTLDRTTSITDVITNTTGTIFGIILSILFLRIWKNLQHTSNVTQITENPLFAPLSLLAFIIIAELLQPFDFVLEYQSVTAQFRCILHDPFKFIFSGKNELFVILLFATLSFISLKVLKISISKITVLVLLTMFNISLVLTHVVIRSRWPQFSEVFIGATGIIVGYLLHIFNVEKAISMRFLLFNGYIISLLFKLYYPFKISGTYQKFNWHPFFTSNSLSTMDNMAKIISHFIVFSFGGYIFDRFFLVLSRKKYILFISFICIASGIFVQGWFDGKPDITDIVVGYSAFLFGRYISSSGEKKILSSTKQKVTFYRDNEN